MKKSYLISNLLKINKKKPNFQKSKNKKKNITFTLSKKKCKKNKYFQHQKKKIKIIFYYKTGEKKYPKIK